VYNSMLSSDGLLEYTLEELGAPAPASSPAQRLLALRRALLDRRRVGQSTVLVLDEAQNLEVTTLERIRLLSNFETPTEKLLQILLVGQPELRAKLNRPELRQLQQRVELQCSLPPLSHEQVRDYIRTRLRVAGARDGELFSDRAQTRIAAYSRGIPRRVNILCDHCLVIGYADQRRRIEVDVVDQAIEALEGGARRPTPRSPSPARRARERWVLGAVAAAALAGVAVLPLRFEAEHLLTLARYVRDLFWR
jgi:general secretion pathway protein A